MNQFEINFERLNEKLVELIETEDTLINRNTLYQN